MTETINPWTTTGDVEMTTDHPDFPEVADDQTEAGIDLIEMTVKMTEIHATEDLTEEGVEDGGLAGQEEGEEEVAAVVED